MHSLQPGTAIANINERRMLPTARRRKTSRILASFWLCMPTNWAWRSISPKCSEPTRYQPKKPIKK